ncbi:hypothetical protein [Pseudobutyrivibrio sp.]|uniref:hypothetical protein n=1 Tax=Pseudobutyrivibrio sp. TaxID=2014367 RepID=UPI001DFA2F86|nr:hypothetical protein [Pseudobutyrivibrio sp.]MBE5910901.1 hypothetical protein [Pseudobutyrivibrio sp.]
MSEEEYFEKYIREELRMESIDPLEYIYYRDSVGFESYLAKQYMHELVDKIIEPILKAIENLIRWWKKVKRSLHKY